jgi:hypothetical protein
LALRFAFFFGVALLAKDIVHGIKAFGMLKGRRLRRFTMLLFSYANDCYRAVRYEFDDA